MHVQRLKKKKKKKPPNLFNLAATFCCCILHLSEVCMDAKALCETFSATKDMTA